MTQSTTPRKPRVSSKAKAPQVSVTLFATLAFFSAAAMFYGGWLMADGVFNKGDAFLMGAGLAFAGALALLDQLRGFAASREQASFQTAPKPSDEDSDAEVAPAVTFDTNEEVSAAVDAYFAQEHNEQAPAP